VAVDQPQPLELHDAGARAEAERVGHAAVGARHAPAEQTRGDVLALRGEVAGEAAQLQDVVVDRRRGDEGAEAVTARDQVLTLEHLERLAQRHERHPEALRELALVVEPRPRREAAGVDAVAQRLGDAVVTRHPCVHGDSSVGVLELRAARIVAGAPNGTNESNDERDLGATAVTGGIVRPGPEGPQEDPAATQKRGNKARRLSNAMHCRSRRRREIPEHRRSRVRYGDCSFQRTSERTARGPRRKAGPLRSNRRLLDRAHRPL